MFIQETGPRITENLGDLLGQMHHFSDGLYAKQMRIPAGHVAGTHAHTYSHLNILAQGDVVVVVGDEYFEYSAPACIEIRANTEHKIFAKTDATCFCIHATDETDVEKIDAVLIHKGD
jgi:mannose-6-phosphate isomerase-like protein (cupin superfamily)